MKLRKLVTNDWVHVSPGLVLGDDGRVWEALKFHVILWRILIGRFICRKMG